jgi:predicted ATPase
MMNGDLTAAEMTISLMNDYAARLGFSPYQGVATVWEGKLLIERGDFANGVALIRRGMNTYEQAGCQMCHAEFLGYLTEGLARLNHIEEAHETIERAISRAQQFGEGLYHAELVRIMGDLLLRWSPDTRAAEAADCFRRAIELARGQGALFWELRSSISLARLRMTQGRVPDARRVLEPVYERFTQGFKAPDMRAAKALLEVMR